MTVAGDVDRTMVCSHCGNEWNARDTVMKETSLDIGGVSFVVSYFSCSKCDAVYRVALMDDRYRELQRRLEDARLRIRMNQGKGLRYKSVVENLVKRANKISSMLAAHVKSTNSRYDGVFTLQHGKDGKDVIYYLPQGHNAE